MNVPRLTRSPNVRYHLHRRTARTSPDPIVVPTAYLQFHPDTICSTHTQHFIDTLTPISSTPTVDGRITPCALDRWQRHIQANTRYERPNRLLTTNCACAMAANNECSYDTRCICPPTDWTMRERTSMRDDISQRPLTHIKYYTSLDTEPVLTE